MAECKALSRWPPMLIKHAVGAPSLTNFERKKNDGPLGVHLAIRLEILAGIFDIELSRSAAVVWLVRTPTSRRWKGGGMAHEPPPSRAAPRPPPGGRGCLTAACDPAGFVAPLLRLV